MLHQILKNITSTLKMWLWVAFFEQVEFRLWYTTFSPERTVPSHKWLSPFIMCLWPTWKVLYYYYWKIGSLLALPGTHTHMCTLDILFCQITTFIKVHVAIVFGLHALWLIDFSKIYQLKGMKPKNNGHMNFYESFDWTKKYI